MGQVFTQLKQAGKQLAIRGNYHLGNFNDLIWVVGDGRSGTTWISNLINWHGRYREMFEPFHPSFVQQLKAAHLHQYLRADAPTDSVTDTLQAIFDGRFYHPRPDAHNRRLWYEGLLIKDIFANLMLAWVTANVPRVKTVMVIRNPFAVAISKQKRTRGVWMQDPRDFLKQRSLVSDYLEPFVNLIEGVGDSFVERQVMIWAVIHYVPLAQLQQGRIKRENLHVLFYENFFLNAGQELDRLFRMLYPAKPQPLNAQLLEKIERPSRSPGKDSNTRLGQSPLDAWRKEVTAAEMTRGLQILDEFGLRSLYEDKAVPKTRKLFDSYCS